MRLWYLLQRHLQHASVRCATCGQHNDLCRPISRLISKNRNKQRRHGTKPCGTNPCDDDVGCRNQTTLFVYPESINRIRLTVWNRISDEIRVDYCDGFLRSLDWSITIQYTHGSNQVIVSNQEHTAQSSWTESSHKTRFYTYLPTCRQRKLDKFFPQNY